jgi:hypothetical protein
MTDHLSVVKKQQLTGTQHPKIHEVWVAALAVPVNTALQTTLYHR